MKNLSVRGVDALESTISIALIMKRILATDIAHTATLSLRRLTTSQDVKSAIAGLTAL